MHAVRAGGPTYLRFLPSYCHTLKAKAYYLLLCVQGADGFSMKNESRPIHANIARLVAQGAEALRIADAAVTTWRDIDSALSPIIGQRGVGALYKRSLYLTRPEYPCLAPVHQAGVQSGEFGTLHAALSQQTSSTAAAANGALLQAFYDLLTNLIGASLTQQLLQSVWDNPSGGDAAQDTTQ
jgi:hypothetical protein